MSAPLQEPLLGESSDVEAEEIPVESEDQYNGYKTSFWIMCLVGLLDSIEYGIIMPAIYNFMKELDPEEDEEQLNHLYGIVLASYSIASLCCKPILGWYCDKRPFGETLVLSSALAIAGNLVYFFARPLKPLMGNGYNALLLARVLAGIGCANTSITFAFVTRTIDMKYRTKMLTLMGMIKVVGFQLGPATTALTSMADFKIDGFIVDSLNAPGFGIALCQGLVVVAIVLKLKEPPPYESAVTEDEQVVSSKEKVDGVLSARTFGLILNFFNIFAYNFNLGCCEAIITPITHQVFGWSPLQNSFIFMVITLVSIVFSMLVMRLSSKGVEDRTFLAIAGVLAILGPSILYNVYFYHMSVAQFYCGVIAMSLPLAFAFSPNRSDFSKTIDGSTSQGFLQSSLSLFGSLGSIGGPIFVGMYLGKRDPTAENQRVAPKISIGLLIFGVIILTSNVAVLWGCRRKAAVSSGDNEDDSEAQ